MKNSQQKKPLNDVERQTFDELYEAHRQRVYSVCLRMTQDAQEAEDLTQDVFVRLFHTIGTFRGEAAFTTWLHRLTVNIVLMHFRRRKVRREFLTETGQLPEEALNRANGGWGDPKGMKVVHGILLSEVMAKLPKGYREAVVLHDIEGLEHNEIAALRGRTAGTSKSQLHKARIMLRQLITQRSQPRHAPQAR